MNNIQAIDRTINGQTEWFIYSDKPTVYKVEWVSYQNHLVIKPLTPPTPVVPLLADKRQLLGTVVMTATPANFSRDWDQAEVSAAVAEQIQAFGRSEYANHIGSSSTSYKYAKKQQALSNALNAAFKPRDAYPNETLSIDTTLYDDPDTPWLSDNSDPIDRLIEEETDHEAARLSILNRLTGRQREIAVLLESGFNQTDIAGRLGIDQSVVSRTIAAIRARLVKG